MKKLLLISLLAITLSSCKNTGNGELTGVQRREKFYQPDPYGMAYVPMGSYTMGVGDQDVPYSHLNDPRTVTVAAFYMDETEITNNEYRQFVYWVRDSIARRLLGEVTPEDFLIEENKKTGETFDPPFLNWETELEWTKEENRDALEQMFLPEHERYYRRKEIDTRKLFYEYYTLDLKAAAAKDYSTPGDTKNASLANRPQGLKDRSVYIRKEVINVYPDTLTWLHDYAYSFNDPMTERYFWHPAYDNYPVVGVNWKQASAFCIWRSRFMESYLRSKSSTITNEFRLPSEAEWEWAARGGNSFSPYPWGGPYTRNDKGCFLANFKPLRGNYIDDGGATSVIVAHYPANDFGLYDMSGNVSEWTNDAFDESASNFTWDMNPSYIYNAKDTDPAALKRKVVRGGSWKDVAYYLQVGTRSYEFQDSSKCYVGFRCVQNYLGRQKDDNPTRASKIYN
jgi:formylglycine-generating enzyme